MTVAAIVLAAGVGRRFGATKQLAELYGRHLVTYPVGVAVASGCSPVVVVVGHDAARVRRTLDATPPVRVVVNERYLEGQATSLRTGLEALPPHAEAVVVLLGDQPHVHASAVRSCIRAWRSGAVVARATYEDGAGHPIVFDRSVWPRLRDLPGDAGARTILPELDVEPVEVIGCMPLDVDVPEHLARLEVHTD